MLLIPFVALPVNIVLLLAAVYWVFRTIYCGFILITSPWPRCRSFIHLSFLYYVWLFLFFLLLLLSSRVLYLLIDVSNIKPHSKLYITILLGLRLMIFSFIPTIILFIKCFVPLFTLINCPKPLFIQYNWRFLGHISNRGLMSYRGITTAPTITKPYLKLYLFYWLMILLLLFTKLFILVWIYIDFYVVVLIAIHTTGINLSILLIIIFVSNVVLMNAIDYLGIIESVLFLVYIRPLQFSMIMFILTNDLLISSSCSLLCVFLLLDILYLLNN